MALLLVIDLAFAPDRESIAEDRGLHIFRLDARHRCRDHEIVFRLRNVQGKRERGGSSFWPGTARWHQALLKREFTASRRLTISPKGFHRSIVISDLLNDQAACPLAIASDTQGHKKSQPCSGSPGWVIIGPRLPAYDPSIDETYQNVKTYLDNQFWISGWLYERRLSVLG